MKNANGKSRNNGELVRVGAPCFDARAEVKLLDAVCAAGDFFESDWVENVPARWNSFLTEQHRPVGKRGDDKAPNSHRRGPRRSLGGPSSRIGGDA